MILQGAFILYGFIIYIICIIGYFVSKNEKNVYLYMIKE